MPVAIVVLPETIPAIYSEKTESALLDRLRNLKGAHNFQTRREAVDWLRSLALPSGWFIDVDAAKTFTQQCRDETPMTPEELATIREKVGMTRADFATALGYGGNSNTRHKHVHELEAGKKAIMPEKAQRARALYVAETAST